MPLESLIVVNETEHDDPRFVAIVERTLNETVRLHQPGEVYVIQIDNWFDHKWLEFSGTVLHEVAIWKSELTLPPFQPARIVSQSHYRAANPSPPLYEIMPSRALHITQQSSRNLRRTLKQISLSGVFVWYSSATKSTKRGSLMIYTIDNKDANARYASFVKDRDWIINKVKGISGQELSKILELSEPDA